MTNDRKYVDYAIAEANAYVAKYKDTPKLQGRNEAQTKDIKEFLAGNPYDNKTVRTAVEEIITERLKDKTPAAEGEKSRIIYLSGPLGANGLLREMAKDGTTDVAKDIRNTLEGAVQSDFAHYKDQISKKLLDGKPIEPYAKYRGLLSGIDTAVQKAAEEMRLPQLVDNTWALSADERKNNALDYLKQQGKNNRLEMYAIALTPDQARAAAKKQGLPEEEAARSAKNFRDTFEDLKKAVPNITLLDQNGDVIYQQKDGKETQRDKTKMAVWEQITDIPAPKPQSPDQAPPPVSRGMRR